MSKSDSKLSAERLRELLHYDPETGGFTWKISRNSHGGKAKVGGAAGWKSPEGRIFIRLDGKLYRAHRLAWLYFTGEWPLQKIDHVNRNCSDNRFDNLRDVSTAINAQNRTRACSTSKSGILGVSLNTRTGRWIASVSLNNKPAYSRTFVTKEDAIAAYADAKRRLHPGLMP